MRASTTAARSAGRHRRWRRAPRRASQEPVCDRPGDGGVKDRPEDERRDEGDERGHHDRGEEEGDQSAVRPGKCPDPSERDPRDLAPSMARVSRGRKCGGPMRIAIRLRLQLRRRVEANDRNCPIRCPPCRDDPRRLWPVRRHVGRGSCACAVDSGVATERAEPATDPTVSERRPPDTTARHRVLPTPTPPAPTARHRVARHRGERFHDSVDQRAPATCSGVSSPRGSRRPCSTFPSTTRTPTDRRSSCSSPVVWPTIRRTRSGRCSSTRVGPASVGPTSTIFADQIFGEEVRERSTSSAGTRGLRPVRTRPSTASTTSTPTSAPSTSRRTPPTKKRDRRHRRAVRRPVRREQRRLVAFIGTHNSARDID